MIGSNTLEKIQTYGVTGSAERVWKRLKRRSGFDKWRCRNARVYASPSEEELLEIETDLIAAGVAVHDYEPERAEFIEFQKSGFFPERYHGGRNSGVWDEKLLEHWIAAQRLDLFNFGEHEIYVDAAACSSPWSRTLREGHEIKAFAIDLEVNPEFASLDYYRQEDATNTRFADSSVRGMSLQCAFEMFTGDDDLNFISEVRRIMRPGGRVVILPLYMHTHYCAYSTPDYFGKGFSDVDAVEYVRMDSYGVPSSRKYDAAHLKSRILDRITSMGMNYQLMALRNKQQFGDNIYCHFILEITK